MTSLGAQEVPELSVPDEAVLSKSESPVYIVMMKDSPVVSYDGSIKGYKATKPAKGKRLEPNSAAVKRYAAYLDRQHDAVLNAVGGGEKVYDYRYALNGFAAVLTADQVDALRARDDVRYVWRDERMAPTTDSTPDYLGLTGPGGAWDLYGKGEDVIIGVLDSGIWPENPSFSDQTDLAFRPGESGKRTRAYGPPPAHWNGTCQSGEQWSQDHCNNKIIGARYYNAGFGHGSSGIFPDDFLSARDSDGHGSHTAGISGGNEGVEVPGIGPISGVAPRARLAIYKVCWDDFSGSGCFPSDSAAAIDQAVFDGVDVINFSIGGSSTIFAGADDIAFLFAADAGIWVATSNGNAGPGPQTTGTPAGVPWITAVGAAQDDQVFGTGLAVSAPVGIADTYDALEGAHPVTLAATGDISGDVVPSDPMNGCDPLTNGADVDGNIALVIRGACSFSQKYNNAAAAGATAIVVYNDGTGPDRIDPITMFAPGTTIPGVMVGFNDGALIDATVGGGDTVTGLVGPSISISLDNRIAGFSSRGPNGGAPDIIKPDVTAPGVGILAAETLDPNRVNGGGQPFQFLSGTSMSSPHAAGAFALLKEAHPDWTAAQARSALMTTARQNLQKTFGGDPADPFDIGAGHIVPSKAFDPGLTYDAGFLDYLAFLCGAELQPQLVGSGTCAFLESFGFSLDSSDLNLPSIGVAELVGTQTVPRTVTSVTPVTATYNVSVDAPPGIDVVVTPSSLTLDPGETATYEVTFTATPAAALEQWAFGSLTWGHGPHAVRSPIAVRPFPFAAPAQVGGSGTDGTLSFDIQFGFAGDCTAGTHGLVPADEQAGNVVDDPANDINTALGSGVGISFHFVDVPAGTDVARFSLFDEDTDGNDDLDLYIFDPGFAFVGGSGSPTSNEQVDLLFPAAGTYLAVVHGWQTDGPDANYMLSSWAFGPDVGNMTVTAPGAAVLGPAGVTVEWSGLGAGTRYLGAVSHSDGGGLIGLTTILIDTR
jgi:hypothetical protein